jgi:4-hydroxy 2-oxovalerate aldolase
MEKAPWITYRPNLKVLDATIRDGGLMNDHHFDDGFVRAVYETNLSAGIDYMELGYKNSKKLFAPGKFGNWKHCSEDDMRRVLGDNPSPLKLTAMADAEKSDYKEDILPKAKSILDTIRVATYVHQLPVAIDMIKDAKDKGYEVTCNIMAISTVQDIELDKALEEVVKTAVDAIVVVDSFGSFYAEQIELLVKKYLRAVEGTGKTVGMHAHNNQQLAFANTIEAIIHGANWVDGTYMGLGRGAGNCPMELLIGFLRNPKFRIRPVWELIQDHFTKLSEELDWGPTPPYIITGQHNEHPRTAIAHRAGEDRDRIVDFYDRIAGDI